MDPQLGTSVMGDSNFVGCAHIQEQPPQKPAGVDLVITNTFYPVGGFTNRKTKSNEDKHKCYILKF